jgi:hypothetical protein
MVKRAVGVEGEGEDRDNILTVVPFRSPEVALIELVP